MRAAKGNYTITAYTWPVPGEIDTTDNTLTDSRVIVAMADDITRPEGYLNGKCDIRDVAAVAILFGVNCPDPNCDLTGPTKGVLDGKIDVRDVPSSQTVRRHRPITPSSFVLEQVDSCSCVAD